MDERKKAVCWVMYNIFLGRRTEDIHAREND